MHRQALPRRPQAGFSMVELMVALAIGLIVSMAVMMGYLGAAQSQRGQSDLSRMQETSRFAFDLFGRETRNAAYRDNTQTKTSPRLCFGPGIAGQACQTSVPYLYAFNDATSPTLSDGTTPTILNHGDVVTFRYYGMDSVNLSTGVKTGNADGSILNCTGTGVAYAMLNEDSIYIARDTTNTTNDPAGEPTLYCSSRQQVAGVWSSPTVVPLIPGVESLQILYGEDIPITSNNNSPDGVVDHYVIPANLKSADLTLVKSLMVSVVVRSPSTSGNTASASLASFNIFNHFGRDYAPADAAPSGDAGSVFSAPGDGRLRRVYNTLFAVRNAL
jgi:type IV pilus assembly protein PilW